jgi:hypothetical protein
MMMQCDYQFQYARWSVKRVSSTDGELHAQSLVAWSRFEAGAVIRERTLHGTINVACARSNVCTFARSAAQPP